MNRTTKKLSDIAVLVNGFAFKGTDFVDTGFPVLKIKNVKPNNILLDDLSYVSPETAKGKENYLVKKGDIVLTMTGNRADGSPSSWVGKAAMYREDEPILLNQRLAIVRPTSNEILNEYLAYYLSSWDVQLYFIRRANSSGGQANISPAIINDLPVVVPSLDEQKKIVTILSTIDEKILVNKKTDRDLKELSELLYTKYFKKFNGSQLSDDGIPEGWSYVSLADLMDYAGGSQPPASEFIEEPRDGYIRFVQIRDYEGDDHITYIPISKRNKLCDENDIMIARYGASLGRICFGLNGAYNVALAKVFPKKEYYREYLRCYLNSQEFYLGINTKGGRSAQAGFNENDIKSFVIAFPNDEEYVLHFNNLLSPIFKKRLEIFKENAKLTEFSFAILPKLISGKIDINLLKISD